MKGIDLRKFKKISGDDRVTTFRDDAGHEVRVAHKALSAQRRKQLDAIPMYYDGGKVEKEEEEIAPIPVAEDAPVEEMGPVKPEPTFFDKVNDALTLPGEREEMALKKWKKGLAEDKEAALAAAPPVEPDRGLAAQPTLAPPVAAPAAPVPAQSLGDYQGVMGQYQQGVNAEAKALGAQGQAEAAIQNEQIQAQQAMLADFTQKSDQALAEIEAVKEDWKNQKINTNHYLESRTAGQKVMTAIGLLLSGFGSGLAGQENMASKFLDDQIARDIKAQEENLGKTESLLSANLKQYGNMKDAMAMTDAMQRAIYATKIEQAASLSKDPLAQARAMQLAAKFKAEVLPNIAKVAQGQVYQGMLSNPNAPPIMKIQALPKEVQGAAIKELNDYEVIKQNLARVAPVMREAFENTKVSEKLANPIQSGQRKQVAFAQLFPIAKAIAGERMTDADARTLIGPYLPGITTNQATLDMNIKKMEEQLVAMAKGRTPILSQYGIAEPLTATPEVKTMGGVKYQKVPGGWQRVK